MKGYTDIEQSKQLTEMLPIESGDEYRLNIEKDGNLFEVWYEEQHNEKDSIEVNFFRRTR